MNNCLKWLRFLLFPLAVLYHAITSIRNFLFDRNYLKSNSYKSTLILIGNLTVGGTGKTPHVEYLIRLLQHRFNVATLSRGYGRKTKGVRIAHDATTAQEIADEPMQFYLKYGQNICVAVGEDRTKAVPHIIEAQPKNQIILLDDAFQHRRILADCQILLSDFNRPFYKDFLLPTGMLRESRKGANRADILIVTKCPTNLTKIEQQVIQKQIYRYVSDQIPIFFTAIRYLSPVPLTSKCHAISKNVLLVTGIAQTDLLVQQLHQDYHLVSHLKYPDHADYCEQRAEEIANTYQRYYATYSDLCIVITEKDFVKIKTPELAFLWKKYPIFYIPIEIYFLQDDVWFNRLILDRIHKLQNQ